MRIMLLVIGYQFSVIGYRSTENRKLKTENLKSLNLKY